LHIEGNGGPLAPHIEGKTTSSRSYLLGSYHIGGAPRPEIADYAERTKEIVSAWKSMDGKQGGDPAKLARALVELAALKEPPVRFAAGAAAVNTFEAKANALLAQAKAHWELSTSLAYDTA
jgi:hypothetical protein